MNNVQRTKEIGVINAALKELEIESNTDHPEADILFLFATHNLPMDDRKQIDDHIGHCIHCATIVEDALEFDKLIRKSEKNEVSVSHQKERLKDQIIKLFQDFASTISFTPAAAAAGVQSSKLQVFELDGESKIEFGSAAEGKFTKITAKCDNLSLANSFLQIKIESKTLLVPFLGQEGNAKITSVFFVDSDFTPKQFLEADEVNKVFTLAEINEQTILDSINATDGDGADAWKLLSNNQCISQELREVILKGLSQ